MADKRLIDFPINPLPTGDDIIYFGDQTDSFREVRSTLNQERSYTPQLTVTASENVTQLYMGKNIISETASPVTITIPLSAGFPITSQFNMIRNDTGAFTLAVAPGVTLNGVDGGSITLPQQFDRVVATEILNDEWTAIEFSGAVGASTLQDAYDNGIDGNISLTVGKPLTTSSAVAGVRDAAMTEVEFKAIATPLTGEHAWDQINGRTIFNKGTPALPVYDHGAYVSDVSATLGPVFGEMYFQDNVTETTIVSQSTPVKIAGTYVGGELEGFTHANGTLTYTGVDTRVFSVNVSTTASLNLNTANITVFIAKNGTVIAQSGQSPDLDGVSPSFVPLGLNKLVSLSTNETIEAWTQNNSLNNEDITHQDLSVTVGSPGLAGAVSKNNNLFAQTDAEARVENTNIETSIKGAGVGSMFFPANSLQAGDTFEFIMGGKVQNFGAVVPGQNLTFRIIDGANVLLDTGSIELKNITIAQSYVFKATTTIQKLGTFGVGRIHTIVDFLNIPKEIFPSINMYTSTTTFDSTIDIDYDVTIQWVLDSASNIITSNIMSFSKK